MSELKKAMDENAILRLALEFYADRKRYLGPNRILDRLSDDPYAPADAAYWQDVTRDGGEIARNALALVLNNNGAGQK